MRVTYDSAQAIADIPGATYSALWARFKALAVVIDAVSAERKALNDEIKRREKETKIGMRFLALAPAEQIIAREVISSDVFAAKLGVTTTAVTK